MLLWLARLPIARSRVDTLRMERRLKLLMFASVVAAGFAPGKRRMGAHLVGRSYRGSWRSFVTRAALPPLSAFNHDRLARIRHIAANIDLYVTRFMKRLARGFLMRRCAARGIAPAVLMSRAPARVLAFADTS
ncbi:hypothetical protein U91I_00366 [alpha proteobacterium U9-1i]|nr:hypothetical protein U91I_00366 [alpha proteobacterium U9-1i]